MTTRRRYCPECHRHVLADQRIPFGLDRIAVIGLAVVTCGAGLIPLVLTYRLFPVWLCPRCGGRTLRNRTDGSAAPPQAAKADRWTLPLLLMFAAFILCVMLIAKRPFGGTLLALAVIGGSIALIVKREWQDKLFGPLGIHTSVKRYAVLGATIVLMALTFVTGGKEKAGATASPTVASRRSPRATTARPPRQPPAKTIPADVTYTIIDKNIVPGIKRSLDIRLNRKVSKDVLEAIAVKLKSSDPNNYERTFIGYYLPGMTVDAGYWATTHFNPNLEVRVLGITAEQEKKLRQQPTHPSGDVIGRWLQDEEPSPGRITIFRDGGVFYMEKTYTDGNTGKDRVVEKPSRKGRKFMKANRPGADGDYYLIDKHGDLQIWSQDVDGSYVLVLTAKAIAGDRTGRASPSRSLPVLAKKKRNNQGKATTAPPMSRPALSPKMALPKYEVIDKMKRPVGGMHGNILVPSFSRATPVAEQQRIAKTIAEKEGCNTVNIYSTREAYKAMNSAAYLKAHPEDSTGYLGSWGVVPNEYTVASEWVGNHATKKTEYARPSRWLNETYNVTVRRVKDKQWEEMQNKTGRVMWRYRETGRTKDYTELFDPKRKYHVRLRPDRMELKKGGKWIWVAKGHWDPASRYHPQKTKATGSPKKN